MATISIALSTAKARGIRQDILPITQSVPEQVATTIVDPASSTQASITGPEKDFYDQHWVVTATGGNVWVKFGSNPTAAAGADWLVTDGQTREFGVTGQFEKAAVIDA